MNLEQYKELKVGDKVRVTDAQGIEGGQGYYEDGMETEVISFFSGRPRLRSKGGGTGIIIIERECECIELIGSNEARRKVIADAKEFLESRFGTGLTRINEAIGSLLYEFSVDRDTATVSCLVRRDFEDDTVRSGSYTFGEGETFNEYIGMAAALNNALYLLPWHGVKNTPQPKGFAEGQILTFPQGDGWYRKLLYRLDTMKTDTDNATIIVDNLKAYGTDRTGMKANITFRDFNLFCVDDSEAQY